MKGLLYIVALSLIPFWGIGQLITSTALSPAGLVQDVLLGPGVQVSNITFTGSPQAIGSFTAAGTNLGITEGIVITTGTVLNNPNGPQGPNNNGSSGVDNNFPGAAILNAISSSSTFNAALLEFDFTAVGDSVSFNYVFGSEEYIEYVDIGNPQAFNDVFGLFITGPGILPGDENIALLPNGEVVSINNVNHIANTQYYVNNGDGDSPPFNASPTFIQYDGFTTVLTARAAVQCGETYHLTIAIGDVGDGILDSGIFLEAQSLKSEPLYEASHTISQEHFGNDTDVAEGCTSATVTINRTKTDAAADIPIIVEGTATESVDYGDIPAVITIPAGQSTFQFDFDILSDNSTNEPDENIRLILMLLNECGERIPDTIELVIKEVDPISVTLENDTLFCGPGQESVLKPVVTGGLAPFTYSWSTGSTADSIVVNPIDTETYSVSVTDFCLKSTDSDEAEVYIYPTPELVVQPIDDLISDCPNTPVQVQPTVSGGGGTYNYIWKHMGQIISTQAVVELSPLTTSTYDLIVQDNCGQLDTISVNYIVNTPVLIPEINAPESVCPGESAQLVASATQGRPPYTYFWPHSEEVTPSVTVNPTEMTTYTVEISDACATYSIPISTAVNVYEPFANFEYIAESYNIGAQVQFNNTSNNAVSFQWDFDNGVTSDEQNPLVSFNQIDSYDVTLIIIDENGCSDTVSKTIHIGHVLYIPNSFTPDGNKFNNEFLVVKQNIQVLNFEIFNRWGELIFSETDDTRLSWDGTYQGKPCPDGTYTYHIRYRDPQQNEFNFIGHVNLIR
ncbi:MAG: T9SS type B sorting domain-containing protein [Bacteroidetes bacterium]|nr:MAG: T9SS type B sorting domain-containing protein [Bacteroidota bacterium]